MRSNKEYIKCSKLSNHRPTQKFFDGNFHDLYHLNLVYNGKFLFAIAFMIHSPHGQALSIYTTAIQYCTITNIYIIYSIHIVLANVRSDWIIWNDCKIMLYFKTEKISLLWFVGAALYLAAKPAVSPRTCNMSGLKVVKPSSIGGCIGRCFGVSFATGSAIGHVSSPLSFPLTPIMPCDSAWCSGCGCGSQVLLGMT